jgi:hypothetical protein
MAFSIADRLSGLDEKDVGCAPHGLEFSVEGDAADAIDAGDASAPDEAEHEFRVADEGEGSFLTPSSALTASAAVEPETTGPDGP